MRRLVHLLIVLAAIAAFQIFGPAESRAFLADTVSWMGERSGLGAWQGTWDKRVRNGATRAGDRIIEGIHDGAYGAFDGVEKGVATGVQTVGAAARRVAGEASGGTVPANAGSDSSRDAARRATTGTPAEKVDIEGRQP